MMPESSLNEPVGQPPTIRRSFTLPTKLNPLAQRGPKPPRLSENVIFYHPSAKIVHFAPRALAPIPSSSAPTDFDYPVDTIETLPWRSATERTVATAPLRLERVHGLTAFLKCGIVVHAILKNSQCWCVDGVSKFVLRIRPLTYYRIEIPYETEEDKALVVDLKTALPTVLRYEVTPCPFKRAFTVELPEDAMAPRRKKAWRPKERKDSLFPASGSSQGSPSETRSEWLDSASTGEDTDGGATDDGMLAPQRTNSSTSSALPAPDRSPSWEDKIEFPSPPKSIRRSVTETPQTFTSLLAKFDASTVPEEGEPSENSSESQEPADSTVHSETMVIPEVRIEHDLDPPFGSPFDPNSTQEASTPAPRKQSVAESVAIFESTAKAASPEQSGNAAPESHEEPFSASDSEPKEMPQTQLAPQCDPTPKDEDTPVPVSEPQSFETTSAITQPDFESTAVPSLSPKSEASPVPSAEDEDPSVALASPEPEKEMVSPLVAKDDVLISPKKTESVSAPVPVPKLEIGAETDPDHDSSFSSTPESFHSVDPQSPSDSVSTHTPPAELQSPNIKHPEEDHIYENVEPLSPKTIVKEPVLVADPPSATKASSIPDSLASKPTSRVADTSSLANSTKHSLAIPSVAKPLSRPTVKASPPTDFDHMSSEFRRRSKATRERDVSPMPPPSAIYQPRAGDQASSFLSKALTLVLVPPISLFIVLLHVAARIVINPALNSSLNDSDQEPRSSKKPLVTEDDFSFPLERESSSEYEDARITKKLDPWDLD